MIQKLLIFESSGICLFSKDYAKSALCEEDELATGFLAVLFGYLDSQFGDLKRIKTKDSILLVNKIQDIYIALVLSRYQQDHDDVGENDRITLLNKQLENASEAILGLLERKVGTLLLQLKIRQENDLNYKSLFTELEKDFDTIVSHGLRKIEVIKKVFENHPITNALGIYRI